MMKRMLPTLVIVLLSELRYCNAFRLLEFELKPSTFSSFTCDEDVATSIETTAENCLVNRCAEYISDATFSYSACTNRSTVAISGGATTVSSGGSLSDETMAVDQCVKTTLESDECLIQFQKVVPNLSSMTFISDAFPLVTTPAPIKSPVAAPTSAPVVAPTSPPVVAPTSPPVVAPTSPPVVAPVETRRPSSAPIRSPTAAPSVLTSPSPSLSPTRFNKPAVSLPVPTNAPLLNAPLPSTSAPITGDAPNPTAPTEGTSSSSRNAAIGAVMGLSAVAAILVGYFAYVKMQKRKGAGRKSADDVVIRPLDTTDTAYDEDVEIGKLPVLLPNDIEHSDRQPDGLYEGAVSESFVESSHSHVFSEDDGAFANFEEGESIVPEEDELSSGSSTLFDVNGNHDDEDGDSSVFYESHGDEDDEDGTEVEMTLEGTWDPEEDTTNLVRAMEQEDEEADQGSMISSLGASADHFGGTPSPQQFMEWIKKSPLIPAAAKASVVAAVELEAMDKRSPPPSPITVPGGPVHTKNRRSSNDDASGWRSW